MNLLNPIDVIIPGHFSGCISIDDLPILLQKMPNVHGYFQRPMRNLNSLNSTLQILIEHLDAFHLEYTEREDSECVERSVYELDNGVLYICQLTSCEFLIGDKVKRICLDIMNMTDEDIAKTDKIILNSGKFTGASYRGYTLIETIE